MVCEILLHEQIGLIPPDELNHIVPDNDAGIIGVFPGEEKRISMHNQELFVECSNDGLKTKIRYIMEDSPLQPRNSIELTHSDQWYPIPAFNAYGWFLVRHRNYPIPNFDYIR